MEEWNDGTLEYWEIQNPNFKTQSRIPDLSY